MQSLLAPSGQVLPNPRLGCVQISECGRIQPFQQAELGFQISVPRPYSCISLGHASPDGVGSIKDNILQQALWYH
jgi:hypothetical protein